MLMYVYCVMYVCSVYAFVGTERAVGRAHVQQLPGCTWLMQHYAGPLHSTVKIPLTTKPFFFSLHFLLHSDNYMYRLLFINEVLLVVVT